MDASPQRGDREPPPLRARRDGWTADRQAAFLASLRTGAWVATAAAAAGMSRESAYRLRRNPRAAAFARDWAAIEAARTSRPDLYELLAKPGRDDATYAAPQSWLAEMQKRPDFTRWLMRRILVLSKPMPKRRVP